jgi:C1A family cysteine protease
MQSARYVQECHAVERRFTIAVNHFDVMTLADVQALRGDIPREEGPRQSIKGKLRFSRALPHRLDWPTENAVQFVKDQNTCGFCWALAAGRSPSRNFVRCRSKTS